MKQCTIYGCSAAAPRNSKVCIEHLKLGVLESGPWTDSLSMQKLDRGASSFFFVNNTGKCVSVGVTMIAGDPAMRVSGGPLTGEDMRLVQEFIQEQKDKYDKAM